MQNLTGNLMVLAPARTKQRSYVSSDGGEGRFGGR
jgi:hypothetical protein